MRSEHDVLFSARVTAVASTTEVLLPVLDDRSCARSILLTPWSLVVYITYDFSHWLPGHRAKLPGPVPGQAPGAATPLQQASEQTEPWPVPAPRPKSTDGLGSTRHIPQLLQGKISAVLNSHQLVLVHDMAAVIVVVTQDSGWSRKRRREVVGVYTTEECLDTSLRIPELNCRARSVSPVMNTHLMIWLITQTHFHLL